MQSTRADFDKDFKKQIKDFFILNNPNIDQWEKFIYAFTKLNMPAPVKLETLHAMLQDTEYSHEKFTTLYCKLLHAERANIDWILLTKWLPIIIKDKISLSEEKVKETLLDVIKHIFKKITSIAELNDFITNLLPSIIKLPFGNIDEELTVVLPEKMLALNLKPNELLDICQNPHVYYLLSQHSNEKQLWSLLSAIRKMKIAKDDTTLVSEIMKLLTMGNQAGSLMHRALLDQTTALLSFKLLEKLEKHISQTQLINLLMLSFPWADDSRASTAIYPFILVAIHSHSDKPDLRQDFVELREKYLLKVLNSTECFTLLISLNILYAINYDGKSPGLHPSNSNWIAYNRQWYLNPPKEIHLSTLNLFQILNHCRTNTFVSWFKQELKRENPKLADIVDKFLNLSLMYDKSTNSNYVRTMLELLEICLTEENYKQQAISKMSALLCRVNVPYFFMRCFADPSISVNSFLDVAIALLPGETFQTVFLNLWLDTFRRKEISIADKYYNDLLQLKDWHKPEMMQRFVESLIYLYKNGVSAQDIRSFLKSIKKYPSSAVSFDKETFCQYLYQCRYYSLIYDLINQGLAEPDFYTPQRLDRTPNTIKDDMLYYYVCQLSPKEKQPILENIRDRSSAFGEWYWQTSGFLCSRTTRLPNRFAQIVTRELAALVPEEVSALKAGR